MRPYPTASVRSTFASDDIIGATIEVRGTRYRVGRPFATGTTAQLFPMAELHPRSSPRAHRRPPLALKLALPSLDADEVVAERMARETALLCSMHHPNIPRGYAGGTWQGLPFIVMERIRGQSLAHALRLAAPFTLAQSLGLVQQLLLALNHIHLDPLILAHRDLKPANIMLERSGEVFLVDFGLALTDFAINHNLATHRAGSLPYQAPEQIAEPDEADIRSDLYSLGAVFYEALTGSRAFQGVSPEAVLERKESGRIPRFVAGGEADGHGDTSGHGDAPEHLALVEGCQKLLDRSLAADPAHRYQTPMEFMQDTRELQRLLTAHLQEQGHPGTREEELLPAHPL